MSNKVIEEPKGIPFFNVKSGDTHYAKLEPTIAGYINSSDMGINASREQNFGWKLGAEWVQKVKAFRRDNTQMSILTARNGGSKPTTVQVLYFLYGEELRAYQEDVEDNEDPFEEQYQKDIANAPKTAPKAKKPAQLPQVDDDDDISDLVDDEDLEPADLPAPAKAATPKQK
jgi:hypothetical protein